MKQPIFISLTLADVGSNPDVEVNADKIQVMHRTHDGVTRLVLDDAKSTIRVQEDPDTIKYFIKQEILDMQEGEDA